MAGLRCIDVQSCPTESLDVTSLTLEEFQSLIPPFEAAFHAHMAAWRLDGKPPDRPPVSRVPELSLSDAGRALVLPPHLPQDLRAPRRPGTPVRHGPEHSPSVDPRPRARAAGGAAHSRRCPDPPADRPGPPA